MRTHYLGVLAVIAAASTAPAFAQDDTPARPNILAIMVDDVAPSALSVYSHGMTYPTPNIDRIGKEGALFTDHYAQPSCTAGRAAFLMGQLPVRTGLTTVGQPGNPLGIQPEDPTLAEILKEAGYRTAQFGKNHLGDLDQHLLRFCQTNSNWSRFALTFPLSGGAELALLVQGG